MKAEIILNWQYGQPTQDGLYFVAVKHGESAGFQEFVLWENNEWQLSNGGDVIAFISLESLSQQLDIQWPAAKASPSDSGQEFEEV